MHDVFLQDLAIVLIVAGVFTLLFHRMKQPVVLGYLVAGVMVGPHTPPFSLIHDQETIKLLSELGVIFLMFALGLEFSLRKLKAVGATAFIAAFLEIVLMFWAGFEIGRFFNWKTMDCLFLGGMLSISSTTIIIKALQELGKTKEKFSELVFGILIVEDILAIVLIALLSGVAMTGGFKVSEIFVTVGQLSTFLVGTLVFGLLLVPRLINYVDRFKSNEMLLITVLGLCLGVSLLAVKLKYSVALGAFLIGAVIAECRQIKKIEHMIEPIRDLFSAIFFVSIGLLIDPKLLVKYIGPILVISLVVIVGKVISCSIGVFVGGNNTRTSLRVGMSLAQIGEFSFIIAGLGLSLKATSEFLYPIAVTVSAITTLTTPYLIKSSDRIAGLFDRFAPGSWVRWLGKYTQRVALWKQGGEVSIESKLLSSLGLQIGINFFLTAGIFVTAAILGEWEPFAPKAAADAARQNTIVHYLGNSSNWDTIMWFLATTVSLPLMIGTLLKLQSGGVLLAEIAIQKRSPGHKTNLRRHVITFAVPFIGMMLLGAMVVIISSNILPSIRDGLIALAVSAVISFLLWRQLIRLYSRAQSSLAKTLSKPAAEEVQLH